MPWRADMVARGCVPGLIEIIEQVPSRVAARLPLPLNHASLRRLALWTLLRWERTFLLRRLEATGVDMWGLTCDLDDLLNEKSARAFHLAAKTDTRRRLSSAERRQLEYLLDSLLQYVADEARALGDHHLGTEHLLLAIIAGADRELASILGRHNVTYESVRSAVLELLERVPPPVHRREAKQAGGPVGPPGARWDTTAIGVPRRFGMGILLVMVTMYAVLFASLKILNAPPGLFVVVTVFVTGVGLGQMFLFGGKYPRAASIWVGACLFPLEMVLVLVYLSYFGGSRNMAADAGCPLALSIPLGAGFGYLMGGLTAGVFLLIDRFGKSREG